MISAFLEQNGMNSDKKIDVVKSNCFGNSFVIIDEHEDNVLEDDEYRRFAGEVLSTEFGLGADNLLVIQRNTPEVWQRIKGAYRDIEPVADSEYIFRMFEPDGSEALCCGNGLMCIANYLHDEYRQASTTIATEVPVARPNIMNIGSDAASGFSWVNLGEPRRAPQGLVKSTSSDSFIGNILQVDNLKVCFREHDLKPYSASTELELRGYFIFTGEPHLVLFPAQEGISVPLLAESVFANSESNRGSGSMFRQRIRFGTWLVDRIGHYVNSNYRDLFPIGININFVTFTETAGCLEYRCFERGINRETLACGTGAMAVAYVARQVFGVGGDSTPVLPHRCRWYKKEAAIEVLAEEDRWYLRGQPEIALRGSCYVRI